MGSTSASDGRKHLMVASSTILLPPLNTAINREAGRDNRDEGTDEGADDIEHRSQIEGQRTNISAQNTMGGDVRRSVNEDAAVTSSSTDSGNLKVSKCNIIITILLFLIFLIQVNDFEELFIVLHFNRVIIRLTKINYSEE